MAFPASSACRKLDSELLQVGGWCDGRAGPYSPNIFETLQSSPESWMPTGNMVKLIICRGRAEIVEFTPVPREGFLDTKRRSQIVAAIEGALARQSSQTAPERYPLQRWEAETYFEQAWHGLSEFLPQNSTEAHEGEEAEVR